jgi:hypothetical protein
MERFLPARPDSALLFRPVECCAGIVDLIKDPITVISRWRVRQMAITLTLTEPH